MDAKVWKVEVAVSESWSKVHFICFYSFLTMVVGKGRRRISRSLHETAPQHLWLRFRYPSSRQPRRPPLYLERHQQRDYSRPWKLCLALACRGIGDFLRVDFSAELSWKDLRYLNPSVFSYYSFYPCIVPHSTDEAKEKEYKTKALESEFERFEAIRLEKKARLEDELRRKLDQLESYKQQINNTQNVLIHKKEQR